jgi:hypothetical protein
VGGHQAPQSDDHDLSSSRGAHVLVGRLTADVERALDEPLVGATLKRLEVGVVALGIRLAGQGRPVPGQGTPVQSHGAQENVAHSTTSGLLVLLANDSLLLEPISDTGEDAMAKTRGQVVGDEGVGVHLRKEAFRQVVRLGSRLGTAEVAVRDLHGEPLLEQQRQHTQELVVGALRISLQLTFERIGNIVSILLLLLRVLAIARDEGTTTRSRFGGVGALVGLFAVCRTAHIGVDTRSTIAVGDIVPRTLACAFPAAHSALHRHEARFLLFCFRIKHPAGLAHHVAASLNLCAVDREEGPAAAALEVRTRSGEVRCSDLRRPDVGHQVFPLKGSLDAISADVAPLVLGELVEELHRRLVFDKPVKDNRVLNPRREIGELESSGPDQPI